VVSLIKHFQAIVLKLWRSDPFRGRVVAEDELRALAIMGAGPGRDTLQAIFDDAGWVLTIADTLASAIALQKEGLVPIVLYDREVIESDWRAVVSLLSRLPPHPCVILLAGSSDNNLWDEFGRYGGSDILRTPVERDEVIRAVKAGWSLWQNQQKLRLLTR
jgi:DNA-binding NtrC family response regulator